LKSSCNAFIRANRQLPEALPTGPFNQKYQGSHLSAMIPNSDYDGVRSTSHLANMVGVR
jgi:hypothetical protein